MARIGVIGTGAIAAPMVRFLSQRGHDLCVTHRSQDVSAALAVSHGVTVTDATGVLDQSDIVIIAVRPHQVEAALDGLAWRADHLIISVMAATPRDRLLALCAPATDLVQTIPLAFLEHGGCPLPAFGNAPLLTDLFAPENPVIEVPSEAALNAHFGICVLVPGILDLMATGAAWLGEQTGDRIAAELYTAHLHAGFLGAMDKGLGQLAVARDGLATEGTLSLQMIETLRAEGCHDALWSALQAIGKRLEQA